MEALRRGAVGARRRFDALAASLITSRRRTYVYAVTDAAAWHRVGVLAVSLCVRYPFSKLVVVSPRAEDADDGVAWRHVGLRLREAMRSLGLDRRTSFAACANCGDTPADILGAALGGMDPARSELVLLAPGTVVAPDEGALGATFDLTDTGCRVARGFVRCAPGTPARSDMSLARVAVSNLAGTPEFDDCAAIVAHALWSRLAPALGPPTRALFNAECKQQTQPNTSSQLAADNELRAVCPNEHYHLSARRRYDWNSRAPEHLTRDPRFDFGFNASLLEIGGPTPFATFVYESVERADNVAERNVFARMNQFGHTYGETGDFDGHPFAPLGTVMGTTYQRHAARLVGVPDAAYDVIMASHVLEHVLDPMSALREWDRKLKPGGRIVLLLPWAPKVDYDARREPSTMQQLVHLFQRNASFDAEILARHAEQLLLTWSHRYERSHLFARCAPGVAAGDVSCGVDENMGHWHVWDFDLLQEAVEGCLGYDLEVMTLQDPWHQVVLARKPFAVPE
jgi:SAM-dependent methyltransferase